MANLTIFLALLTGTPTLGTIPTPTLRTYPKFIALFCSARKCSEKYPKAKKIDIFYQALTVDKSKILGESPSPAVRVKFNAWIQVIKSRRKWKLDAIAASVYLIARHVHDRQETLALSGPALTNSKIVALVLMYQFYITAINHAELQRQSQNAAARMSLQQQQATSKEMMPLPVDFRYDANKVSSFLPDIFP